MASIPEVIVLELPRKFLAEERMTYDRTCLKFTSKVLDFEIVDNKLENCQLNIKNKDAITVSGDVMTIKTSSAVVKVHFSKQTEGPPVVKELYVERLCPRRFFNFSDTFEPVYSHDQYVRIYHGKTSNYLHSWYGDKLREMQTNKTKDEIELHLKKLYDV